MGTAGVPRYAVATLIIPCNKLPCSAASFSHVNEVYDALSASTK